MASNFNEYYHEQKKLQGNLKADFYLLKTRKEEFSLLVVNAQTIESAKNNV